MKTILSISLFASLLILPAARAHDTNGNMVQTAKTFLAALDSQQLAKATFAFPDDERENWHFIPKPRKGLPLREMTPTQQHLATALLSSGLSGQGFIKALEIMSLEDILKEIEHGTGPVRDPQGYFFSVFGEPSETGTWGFRIEGHHVSQNFTFVSGKLSGSPEFFGANPAEIKDGPRKGLRVLAHEEDLGRALMLSLNPEQRKIATVAEVAYKDIFTMASRQAALEGQPNGLPADRLDAAQRQLLQALLAEYANNVAAPLAEKRLDQIHQSAQIYFAWAGSPEKGQPHYYRIQSDRFLIEYDDTQNNGNHIHSVWRDYKGDFGRDLLKEHYQSSADHTPTR